MLHQLPGPCTVPVCACPAPPGSADAAVIPSGIGGFIACKALSKRNTDPATASRPWDRERDGFVMGEGAGELGLSAFRAFATAGCLLLGLSGTT